MATFTNGNGLATIPYLHGASGIGFIAPFVRNHHAMRPAQNPKAKLPLWKIHQRCLSNASVGNKFDQKKTQPWSECLPGSRVFLVGSSNPGARMLLRHHFGITWAFFGIRGTPPQKKNGLFGILDEGHT